MKLDEKVQEIIDCFPDDGLKKVQKLMAYNNWTFSKAVCEYYKSEIKDQ